MSELKLIRISVDRKFIIPLRLVFFLMAVPFLLDAYEIWITGIADNNRSVRVTRDDGWYYVFLGRELIFALLFIWFGTGGLKVKQNEQAPKSVP